MLIFLSFIAIFPAIRLLIMVAGLLFSAYAFGQKKTTKTVEPEKRAAKLSLISNYYEQDGEHSAINGGLGSQELKSYAQEAHIFIPIKDSSAVNINAGVDHFTSASLATIDKYRSEASGGTSGVSGDETRIYGSVSFDLANKKKRFILSPSIGFSTEYDVQSVNGGLSFSKYLPKNDAIINSSLSLIMDKWMVVHPGEFRSNGLDAASGASESTVSGYASPMIYTGAGIEKDGQKYPVDYRQSVAWVNNYAFTINRRMNAAIGLDLLGQAGLLSMPFHRVYFNDGVADEYQKEVRIENLPRERYKIALSGRFNYFINPVVLLRAYARLYTDTWGIKAFTANIEVPLKVSKALSISPFYRLHLQEGTKYYHGYGRAVYEPKSYYTSDIDLATFSAHRVGAGMRYTPFKSVAMGVKEHKKSIASLKDVGVRYGNYWRLDGLTAQIATLEINFEF